MKVRCFQLVEFANAENTALSKAPSDVSQIAGRIGFADLFVNPCEPRGSGIVSKCLARIRWFVESLRVMCQLRRGDVLLLQKPPQFFCRRSGREFLLRLRQRGVRIIYFIHDIAELREPSESRGVSHLFTFATIEASEKVVVHSVPMKQWLIRNGVAGDKVEILGIFDYLLDTGIPFAAAPFEVKPTVVVAGNLNRVKSPYVYHVDRVDVNWNLYGPNYETTSSSSNVDYCGSFPPDELPKRLKGNFGLVWDGDSIDTCAGVTGDYLRYNCPHKLSLYLACGLPVIVWKDSAMASFIIEHGVGISVQSLHDILQVLSTIDCHHYETMVMNCEKLALSLRAGEFTAKALAKVLS